MPKHTSHRTETESMTLITSIQHT